MKLWRATVCRMILNPVRSQHEEVLIHAKTPQAAGRLLKRAYPGWECLTWGALTDSPIVMHIKTLFPWRWAMSNTPRVDRIINGKSGDPMSERQAERLYDLACLMECELRAAQRRYDQLAIATGLKPIYGSEPQSGGQK